MQLLKQGAEAKLYKTNYLGRTCVIKVRENKKYREHALDEKILRERIRTEATLLNKAKKVGIRTPVVWKIDLKEKAITTEFIPGKTLKEELLEKSNLKFCKDVGTLVGKLHKKDVIHGDLTTSNIIIYNGKLVFIDFGLGGISSKIEDKAVDILVFKKTFAATHYKVKGGWEEVEKAYQKAYSNGKSILKHLEDVEARARYF